MDTPEDDPIFAWPPEGEGDAPTVGIHLCSLHQAATALHEGVEATRRDPAHIVDLAQFESRARQIAALRHLHTELQGLVALVARYGSAADALHDEEIQAMQDYLATAGNFRARPEAPPDPGPAPGVPWKDKTLTARVFCPATPAAARADEPAKRKRPAAVPRPPRKPFARQTVTLAGQVTLDAVIVPDALANPRDITDAVSTPELYFIPRWDHFAVRVGGVVFHGNIGTIYPAAGGKKAGGPPRRVKECRLGSQCKAGCSYYHDPAEVAGSTDTRNFVADGWLYVPAVFHRGARYGSRRLGSRENLELDLQTISAADARRYVAQTAHDILCAVVLTKYVLGRQF